jgi:hypothetical protein
MQLTLCHFGQESLAVAQVCSTVLAAVCTTMRHGPSGCVLQSALSALVLFWLARAAWVVGLGCLGRLLLCRRWPWCCRKQCPEQEGAGMLRCFAG